MRKVLTKEMEKYFIENAFKESQKTMASKFGVSRIVVKRVFKMHNIKVPKNISIQLRTEKLKGRTSFTDMEDLFITENYLDMPVKTIAKVLNRSFCGVMGRINSLGLIIPEEIRHKRKESAMYHKGQEPFNKGKKQTEYLTPEQIKKCLSTSFKKGHIPHNSLPDNSERIRVDKRAGKKYVLVKIPGQRKLKYKHIHVWETHNNKALPDGHNIIFKNGNTMDCNIDNLEFISNSELMKRNSLHNYPPEIKELIHIKGAIKRQINKLQNQ